MFPVLDCSFWIAVLLGNRWVSLNWSAMRLGYQTLGVFWAQGKCLVFCGSVWGREVQRRDCGSAPCSGFVRRNNPAAFLWSAAALRVRPEPGALQVFSSPGSRFIVQFVFTSPCRSYQRFLDVTPTISRVPLKVIQWETGIWLGSVWYRKYVETSFCLFPACWLCCFVMRVWFLHTLVYTLNQSRFVSIND